MDRGAKYLSQLSKIFTRVELWKKNMALKVFKLERKWYNSEQNFFRSHRVLYNSAPMIRSFSFSVLRHWRNTSPNINFHSWHQQIPRKTWLLSPVFPILLEWYLIQSSTNMSAETTPQIDTINPICQMSNVSRSWNDCLVNIYFVTLQQKVI